MSITSITTTNKVTPSRARPQKLSKGKKICCCSKNEIRFFPYPSPRPSSLLLLPVQQQQHTGPFVYASKRAEGLRLAAHPHVSNKIRSTNSNLLKVWNSKEKINRHSYVTSGALERLILLRRTSPKNKRVLRKE